MGPDGVLIHSDAFPPEKLVDTLGAGDTFNASVIYSLSNSKEEGLILKHKEVRVYCKLWIEIKPVPLSFLQGAAYRMLSHLAARLQAKNAASTDMMEFYTEHGGAQLECSTDVKHADKLN